MDETTALQFFKLLPTDLAANWLEAQSEDVQNDYDDVMTAFTERFVLTRCCVYNEPPTGGITTNSLYTETIDAFISDVRKMANRGELHDEKQISFAILHGLKQNIR